MKTIEIEIKVKTGADVRSVIGEVKELSEFLKEDIWFKFNGVGLCTKGKSIQDMVDYYTHQI